MMKIYLFILFSFIYLQSQSQDISNLKTVTPFKISGSIDIRGIGYGAKGIENRRNPFTYILSGSPTLSIYGLDIPLSFSLGNQGQYFSQPFNQFGLSPTYKWVTVHAGYRNVSFSPYTLAGHTILGGGVELNPGKFQVGFMTGRLNKATAIDTISGYMQPAQFSRFGSAVKLGFGASDRNLSFSFITAKDVEKGYIGSLDSNLINLAANSVLSSEFKYTLFSKLYVYGDGAVSIYTKNINSDLTLAIDSTKKQLKTLEKFFNLNATSEYFLAYKGGIGLNEKNFGLKAEYKVVEPNFQSMGAYFFQNDLKNISLSPSFNFFRGKLRFDGSVGLQRDNLKDKKVATTKRVISSANVSWSINEKFGIDGNYSNFSTNSEPTVAMVENKYLLAQTNSTLSVTPRLVLANSLYTHIIILSYNTSSLKDLNEETANASDIFSSVALLNYNLTLNQLNLNISPSISYVNNKLPTATLANKSFSLGLSKGMLKNKLRVSSNNAFTMSDLVNGKGTILNLGLNSTYMLAKKHRIGLRVSFLTNHNERENSEAKKYSETTAEVGYTLNF